MTAPAITDPAVTLERCFERLHFLERELATAIADGHPGTAKVYRRRIAATRGAITRATRMLA